MRKQIPLTEYIIAANIMQLRLNLNIEQYIQDDGKVQLVQNIVERMNIQEIFKNDNNKGRKPSVNPITMLKVIIFCYSEGIYSTRAIEKMCKYDLRVKYILNEEKQVDHSTISRYQKRLIGTTEKLLQEFTQILIEEKLIDLSSVYIDRNKD
ncbi:transposase, partial [Peptoanaerobacter stomatis]